LYSNGKKTKQSFNRNISFRFQTIHIPAMERKKDDKFVVEYNDENVNDRIMLPILNMSYRYFVVRTHLIKIIHRSLYISVTTWNNVGINSTGWNRRIKKCS